MNNLTKFLIKLKSKLTPLSRQEKEKAVLVLAELHSKIYEDTNRRIHLFHQPLIKPDEITYFYNKKINVLYIGENQFDFRKWVDLMYNKLIIEEPEEWN